MAKGIIVYRMICCMGSEMLQGKRFFVGKVMCCGEIDLLCGGGLFARCGYIFVKLQQRKHFNSCNHSYDLLELYKSHHHECNHQPGRSGK